MMTQSTQNYHPLPTLTQFEHCHNSLWERPADLAEWESHAQQQATDLQRMMGVSLAHAFKSCE